MPEDIPEPVPTFTEADVVERACDWSDYRKDYGVSADERVAHHEYLLFCAGWDARHAHGLSGPQRAAIDKVRHLIEANSHATATIAEALVTEAATDAEARAVAAMSPLERGAYERAKVLVAEAQAEEDRAEKVAALRAADADVEPAPATRAERKRREAAVEFERWAEESGAPNGVGRPMKDEPQA